MNFKNYATVNKIKAAEEKNWCLSAKPQKSLRQTDVILNRKTYSYACRYPVGEGDIVIIGNVLDPLGNECAATTGQMGQVASVLPKLEINRSNAVEIDFVFTPTVEKKQITQCIKYLSEKADQKNLQMGNDTVNIYPITFYARQILAACSVLAHTTLATAAGIQQAKDMLHRTFSLDEETVELGKPWPGASDIILDDVQINAGKIIKDKLAQIPFYNKCRRSRGCAVDGEKRPFTFNDQQLSDYVNEAAYTAAIAIMVRGGFLNLLQVFMDENPSISGFKDDILNELGSTGNVKALNLLNN